MSAKITVFVCLTPDLRDEVAEAATAFLARDDTWDTTP